MPNFIQLNAQDIALDSDTKIIKREEYAHYLDANGIIKQAENKAKNIIDKAENSKNDLYEQGFKAGYDDAQQQQAEMLLSTLSLCKGFIESRQEDIIELTMRVCRKLLGDIDVDKLVLQLTEQVLADQVNVYQATLHVSPQQFALIHEKVSVLIKKYPGVQHLDISEDDNIEPGNCVLETPVGLLNAELEVQLSAIESALKTISEKTSAKS